MAAGDPLDTVIADYVQQVEAGQVPDREALLAQHPDLADRLRAFFADYDRLDRQAGELRLSGDPDRTTDLAGPHGDLPRVRYFGDYELLEAIAHGGMGIVYKARQVSLNRLVALKMILRGELATPRDVARFRAEAEAAANLNHPHIVSIYEVGEHDGQQYYAMRFIEGTSLTPHPRAEAPREARLVATVARAVYYAHQHGILHRDLKPSNILVDPAGVPHVADFGLAKRVDAGVSLTESGAVIGTPRYMAPEQAAGRKDLTVAADVYSLGVVLYERLTGQTPFAGDTPLEILRQVREIEPPRPSSIAPGLNRDLETICMKCLEKEPAKRYRSAEALAEDLERWLRGEPIQARPVGQAERAWRWCRRNPVVASLTTAVVFTLATGIAVSTYYAVDARREKNRADEKATLADERAAQADEFASAVLKAKEEEELAGKQATNAMEVAYDVILKADDLLKDKAEMGPFRKQLLDSAMKRFNNISRALVDSGKADRTMAAAIQRMGIFYEQMGRSGDAVRAYKDALRVFEHLIRENPDEDRNRSNAAICYDNLGEMGREVEPDPAVLFDYYRKALELRQALVAQIRNPAISAAERRWFLGVSFNKLGTLCLIVGDPAQADSLLHKALEQYQAAAAADPGNDRARRLYSSETYYLLGSASAHLGRPEAARDYLERSRKLREELTVAEPLNLNAKMFLAATDDALGDLALEQDQLELARQHYQKAHDSFEQLCQADNNPELRWYRSFADYHLGTVWALLHDPAAAQQALRRCLQARQALLKDDTKNPQRKIEVMLALARLGEHKQATALAEELQAYAPHHPGMLFAVGCTYALCRAAAKDATMQERYTEKAIKALEQGVRSGYRAVRELERAPDLEPLRGSPGYKSLIVQMARN
jgi:serine/threonine-protein kinase